MQLVAAELLAAEVRPIPAKERCGTHREQCDNVEEEVGRHWVSGMGWRWWKAAEF